MTLHQRVKQKPVRVTPTDEFHKTRLMSLVRKGPNENDCWEWMGTKKRHGYVRIGINWIQYTASRLSWAVHNGRDPRSLEVCHSCDNTGCCNPKHLFLGTHKENMQDAVYRGRKMGFRLVGAPNNKGEKNPMAKLTQAKADQIRKLYRAGGVSYSDLARRFGIGLSAVGKVVKGERWAAAALEFDDLEPAKRRKVP